MLALEGETKEMWKTIFIDRDIGGRVDGEMLLRCEAG